MLDHIALLRAIKKKKNFSRPTDPASRRASMDKQTIFFYWPNWNNHWAINQRNGMKMTILDVNYHNIMICSFLWAWSITTVMISGITKYACWIQDPGKDVVKISRPIEEIENTSFLFSMFAFYEDMHNKNKKCTVFVPLAAQGAYQSHFRWALIKTLIS